MTDLDTGAAAQWPTLRLGEIADTQLGKTINPRTKDGPRQRPYLRNANVQWGRFDLRDVATMHFSEAESKTFDLNGGDLLVCEGGMVGRAAIWDDAIDNCHFQNALHRVRPKNGAISNEWLLENLRWLSITGQLAEAAQGVTIQHLSQKQLRELPIFMPPRELQDSLVGRLDRVRRLAESAKANLNGARRALADFRQSVLAAACTGGLTSEWRSRSGFTSIHLPAAGDPRDPDAIPDLPAGWTWMTPDDLRVTDRPITYGVIKLGAELPDGVATLRSSDVRMLRIDESGVKHIATKIADNYARTYLRGSEVLVTVRGSLGGVAVAPDHMRGWNISREVAMIPIGGPAIPGYVALAIASPRSQQWMNNVTKGVTYTGINIRDLKRLPLPIPSLAEQKEILKRVEALFSLGDSVAKRIDAASRATERGAHAALAKAFEGDE